MTPGCAGGSGAARFLFAEVKEQGSADKKYDGEDQGDNKKCHCCYSPIFFYAEI
jgi:hypothetical protein